MFIHQLNFQFSSKKGNIMKNNNNVNINGTNTPATTQPRMGNLYWHLIKDRYVEDPATYLEEMFRGSGLFIGIPKKPESGFTKVQVLTVHRNEVSTYFAPALCKPVKEPGRPWLFRIKHVAPSMGAREGFLMHLEAVAPIPKAILDSPALGFLAALSGRFPQYEAPAELPEAFMPQETFINLMKRFATAEDVERGGKVTSLQEACHLAWEHILEAVKADRNVLEEKLASFLSCFVIKSNEEMVAEKLAALRAQMASKPSVAAQKAGNSNAGQKCTAASQNAGLKCTAARNAIIAAIRASS